VAEGEGASKRPPRWRKRGPPQTNCISSSTWRRMKLPPPPTAIAIALPAILRSGKPARIQRPEGASWRRSSASLSPDCPSCAGPGSPAIRGEAVWECSSAEEFDGPRLGRIAGSLLTPSPNWSTDSLRSHKDQPVVCSATSGIASALGPSSCSRAGRPQWPTFARSACLARPMAYPPQLADASSHSLRPKRP